MFQEVGHVRGLPGQFDARVQRQDILALGRRRSACRLRDFEIYFTVRNNLMETVRLATVRVATVVLASSSQSVYRETVRVVISTESTIITIN